MTIQEWQAVIGLILGVAAVAGVVFTILRFYIKSFAKQELEEIKHELKPNGGSSMKDQITRLEKSVATLEQEHKMLVSNHKETHDQLREQDSKITKIYETLIDYVAKHNH
jgi:predicted transcriptional regulator